MELSRKPAAREEVSKRVQEINWFHQIPIEDGIITPGPADCAEKLQWLKMPEDLTGLSVLDVGAWDGFYSFEAERRGAQRVLATDSFCWGGPGWGTKDGFLLAREALGSSVEDFDLDVFDLSPERIGTFDLVLFLGVLYHVRHPLLALEKVASVTKSQLILETHAEELPCERRPAMIFRPFGDVDANTSNWGPNREAVMEMLKSVGFREVRVVWKHPLLTTRQRFKRLVWLRLSGNDPFPGIPPRGGRLVIHAWK